MAGFGTALTQVGAQFLEQIQKVEIDNQLSEFEGVTTEQINAAISGYVNDPEAGTYLERFKPQLEAIQKENLQAVKNPQARRIAENWFKRRSAGWQKQVQSMATGRAIQNTKDGLDLAEFRAIQQRDPELINRPVTRAVQDGVIGEAEGELIIEQTHYKILLGEIEDEAWETISEERAAGADAWQALSRGLAAIEERREEITLSDKNQISNKIERSFTYTLSAEIAREEEKKAQSKDKAVELTENSQTTYEDIEALDLDEEEKEKVRKAKMARNKDGSANTNYKSFNSLIGRVIEGYTDLSKKGEIEDEITDAYFERKISYRDYKNLREYLDRVDYPTGIVGRITEVFQDGADKIGRWWKTGDPVRIAAYNRAMFDWLAQQTDKDGKFTATQEEIYSQSQVLIQLYKDISARELRPKKLPPLPTRDFYESHPEAVPKGIEAYRDAGQEPPDWMLKLAGIKAKEKEDTPKTLPEPKTKAEYDKLKSGTKYIDPTGVERIKK